MRRRRYKAYLFSDSPTSTAIRDRLALLQENAAENVRHIPPEECGENNAPNVECIDDRNGEVADDHDDVNSVASNENLGILEPEPIDENNALNLEYIDGGNREVANDHDDVNSVASSENLGFLEPEPIDENNALNLEYIDGGNGEVANDHDDVNSVASSENLGFLEPEPIDENNALNLEYIDGGNGEVANDHDDVNSVASSENYIADPIDNVNNHPPQNNNIDEGDYDDDDEPFYEGANITKKQAQILIMGFALRYHIADKALQDLLDLINCVLPQPILPSLYMFLKDFPNQSELEKHFYCPECEKPVDFEDSDEQICECNAINLKKTLDSQQKYFLTVPIATRLQKLLSKKEIYSNLNCAGEFSDVRSGKICKRLAEIGRISKDDITLQFNTDGAQVFHSSKLGNSLWPIQVSINELDYNLRRANIIVGGLWMGQGSPRMDVFLRPFVDEMKKLCNEGIQVTHDNETKTIKCHLLIGTLDSTARPKVAEMSQFNGQFGCSYCLNEGMMIAKGKGHTRVYGPYLGELRTENQVLTYAAQATPTNPVNGVKGVSILAELPNFSVVKSFVPDYMHSDLLGVAPTVTDLWLNSNHKKSRWYIGDQVGLINERIEALTPTSEMTRIPSKVEQRSIWKAAEWRNWLLYYSLVVLKGILPDEYYKHWLLLVCGIRLLLQNSLNSLDIRVSKAALKKFVEGIEELYGQDYLTFNVHLLLHKAQYAKDWGALWASSTFPFEHGNGTLLSYFNGTRAVMNQIFWSYDCLCHIKSLNTYCFNGDFYEPAQVLANKLIYGKRYVKKYKKTRGVTLLGSGKPINVSMTTKRKILTLLEKETETDIPENTNIEAHLFYRFIVDEIMYCGSCNNNKKPSQRNNSVVQLKNDKFVEVNYVLNIRWNHTKTCPIIVGKKLSLENYSLVDDMDLGIRSSLFLHSVFKSHDLSYYLCSEIYCKAAALNLGDKMFVTPLVNIFEQD